MSFEPNWKPPSNEPRFDISNAIVNEALQVVATQMPDLIDLFPFRNSFHTKLRLAEGWLGLVVEFSQTPGIPSIDDLAPTDVATFRDLADKTSVGSHQDLRSALGSDYFSFSKFSYLGPYRDGKISWPHLTSHILSWMNELVVPDVLKRNQARVLRAIPPPPRIDIGVVSSALWVLECDESIRQGTGFALAGIGVVTCDHVLGVKTKAFRALTPSDKREVSVRKREPAIDLALLAIDGLSGSEGLARGSADHLKQLDHVTICGFPNYRIGDSGTIVPGLVVGFRSVAGIRRVLTNAPIIGGTSGGPALDASGKVIGVAVTGADRMESAQTTEDHGIIPIDALSFLHGSG